MFKLGFKELTVLSVKRGLLRKDTHDVALASSAGKCSNIRYGEQAMAELLQSLGLSKPEELKGLSVVVNDRRQVAYLPRGAELTLAFKSADGKLTEVEFR